jgi:hypothetical protein
MKLLTKELRKKLPSMFATQNQKDPMVICKFFDPGSHWTWYAIEFDGKDTFFGYVVGDCPELGCFSLSELEKLKAPLSVVINGKKYTKPRACSVERDMYFKPCRLSEVKKRVERVREL